MNKTELLAKVSQSRAEFEALISQFSDEQMLQPVLPGGWTVKDALAHIAWWARRGHIVINAVINGLEPEYSLDESDVDNVNRNTYEANRLRPLADLRREEVESYRTLFALVESLPDDKLSDPSQYAWTKGRPLSVVVEWNTFGHYDEHMPDLRRVLKQ
jgi:hypothetical protein